ncbi:hypothetical protein ACFL5Z_13795 [Planctomycetota bacterium]
MMKKISILTIVVAMVSPLVLSGCTDRAEQERLQKELTSAKAAAKKVSEDAKKERDELTAQITTLTEERDALQTQINELNQQTVSQEQLRKRTEELTGIQKQLQIQLADVTREQQTLRKNLTEVTESRNTLQQEVDALAKTRDTALAEAQRAQTKINELTTKLQAQTDKVGELQEQLQSVAVDIEEGVGTPTIRAIESPIIRSFTTTRPKVSPGQKSTLSWWVMDADKVRIEPNIGSVGALGSRTIAPTKTTTYTIIATNEDGESRVTRHIEVL